jgi:hypothetical protein
MAADELAQVIEQYHLSLDAVVRGDNDSLPARERRVADCASPRPCDHRAAATGVDRPPLDGPAESIPNGKAPAF